MGFGLSFKPIDAIGAEKKGTAGSLGFSTDPQKKKPEENQQVAYTAPILNFPPSTEASAIRGRGENFNAIG